MRKIVAAALIVASAILGMAVPSVAAASDPAASDAKIVIVVGADTPQYLDDANELYAEAVQHTSNVIRVYSPNATWSAVKAAAAGANVLIYLGHGNGWPNPYSSNPNGYTTKDGFGLNASASGTHYNLTYYGEPYIKELDLAPGAIVFLHHLCYASGNSEPGKTPPTLTVAKQRADNYASAFLAAGASAVIADGHSHSSYYLRSLFTEQQSLGDFWRNAPNYHGHDIAFTPTRSTGTAVLDPDQGGSSPSGYYRSIVGDLDFWTQDVIGLKLPPGVRGDPGVTVVPMRDPGSEPVQTPEDAAAEAAGPQPLVLVRTMSVHIRRMSVPSR